MNGKKAYQLPTLEMTVLKTEDIIVTSPFDKKEFDIFEDSMEDFA